MAERQAETLKENRIVVEKVKEERAAEETNGSAALKERSRIESHADGQLKEERQGEPKQDGAKGELDRSGTRKYVTALIFFLCLAVGVSGGLLIRARNVSSPEAGFNASQGYLYFLKPFFVPLSKSGSKQFLRATIALELSKRNSTKQIMTRSEEVRSSILKILVSAPPETVENTQGKDLLAEEIISAVNLLVEGKVVKRVIFNDLLVI